MTQQTVSYKDAKKICEVVGGHLLDVRSMDEWFFMQRMLRTVTCAWIGRCLIRCFLNFVFE